MEWKVCLLCALVRLKICAYLYDRKFLVTYPVYFIFIFHWKPTILLQCLYFKTTFLYPLKARTQYFPSWGSNMSTPPDGQTNRYLPTSFKELKYTALHIEGWLDWLHFQKYLLFSEIWYLLYKLGQNMKRIEILWYF